MRSKRERKKADKRRRIVAAATRLFVSRGYDGTTTRAIADEAGIATGTLFLYARTKDEALALVYGGRVDEALDRASTRGAARGGLGARLARRLEPLLALYAERPDLALRYVARLPALEEAERPAHAARNARFLAVVRAEVEAGVESGELAPDLDVARASTLVFGVVRFEIFGWLAAGGRSAAAGGAELAAALDLVVRGLGRRDVPGHVARAAGRGKVARRPPPRRR